MRKLILLKSLLLVVCAVIATPQLARAYDFYANGLYFNKLSSNTAQVTYKDTNYNSYSSSGITIPSTVTYGGTTYTVTSIGHSAFA